VSFVTARVSDEEQGTNGMRSPYCAWGSAWLLMPLALLKKLGFLRIVTAAAICVGVWSFDSFGLGSPITALVINWLVVCWVATGSLLLHFAFPASYYGARRFEGTGQFYQRVGIRVCKRLLRRGLLRILSPKLRIPNPVTVEALRNLENEMRKAETIHVLVFVRMWFVVGYAATKGWVDAAVWMLLFNMLFNVYPAMLQRYNRIKLQKLNVQTGVSGEVLRHNSRSPSTPSCCSLS
jgi:hypothetical protein